MCSIYNTLKWGNLIVMIYQQQITASQNRYPEYMELYRLVLIMLTYLVTPAHIIHMYYHPLVYNCIKYCRNLRQNARTEQYHYLI